MSDPVEHYPRLGAHARARHPRAPRQHVRPPRQHARPGTGPRPTRAVRRPHRTIVPLTRFLSDWVFGQRDVVIEYQRANGAIFHTPESHRHFADAVAVVDSVHGTDSRSLAAARAWPVPVPARFVPEAGHPARAAARRGHPVPLRRDADPGIGRRVRRRGPRGARVHPEMGDRSGAAGRERVVRADHREPRRPERAHHPLAADGRDRGRAPGRARAARAICRRSRGAEWFDAALGAARRAARPVHLGADADPAAPDRILGGREQGRARCRDAARAEEGGHRSRVLRPAGVRRVDLPLDMVAGHDGGQAAPATRGAGHHGGAAARRADGLPHRRPGRLGQDVHGRTASPARSAFPA